VCRVKALGLGSFMTLIAETTRRRPIVAAGNGATYPRDARTVFEAVLVSGRADGGGVG